MFSETLLKKAGLYILAGVIGGTIGYLISEQLFKKEDVLEEVDENEGEVPPWAEPVETGQPVPFKVVDYNSISNAHLKAGKNASGIETRKLSLTEPEKPKVYLITFEQFVEEHVHDYEKAVLTYYAGDGAVIDDQDVPATDAIGEAFKAGPVGLDIESRKAVDGTLYVRNDRLAKDFEIMRVERPYMVTQIPDDYPDQTPDIDGDEEAPPKKKASRSNRKLRRSNGADSSS